MHAGRSPVSHVSIGTNLEVKRPRLHIDFLFFLLIYRSRTTTHVKPEAGSPTGSHVYDLFTMTQRNEVREDPITQCFLNIFLTVYPKSPTHARATIFFTEMPNYFGCTTIKMEQMTHYND